MSSRHAWCTVLIQRLVLGSDGRHWWCLRLLLFLGHSGGLNGPRLSSSEIFWYVHFLCTRACKCAYVCVRTPDLVTIDVVLATSVLILTGLAQSESFLQKSFYACSPTCMRVWCVFDVIQAFTRCFWMMQALAWSLKSLYNYTVIINRRSEQGLASRRSWPLSFWFVGQLCVWWISSNYFIRGLYFEYF